MKDSVIKLQHCSIVHIDADALAPTGRNMLAQGVARSASPGYTMLITTKP